ncbi:asparagine synthase-related protein, partial [Salmonella enterica subsp. enterica serovar Anatum]|nr:asparagine synthase-related protein [Salmonella enterica subsp. enterica serovar Anatum]
VLRECFESYLPASVAWRQKEQFSDGVGYSWIDTLKEVAAKQIFQEYRHFNFDIMTACGVAVVRMATVLTKNRRENIIKIFGVIR